MEPATVTKRDVIIIGGGAAGLMCAMVAGRRGRSVLLLEHAERLGKKILISGGGRCNFTNRSATAANYVSTGNTNFCKSALARFTPDDFLALVEQHGIAWHERKHGQLFCDVTSRSIVELLQAECAGAGVEFRLNCRVQEITKPGTFRLETNQGRFECDSLVIATGGLSFAKLGATDFGHRLAAQFGLKLVATRPGLVPLTFGGEDLAVFAELTGLAFEVEASCDGVAFRENLLLTHRGISGPTALQVSNYWRAGEPVAINLLPGRAAREVLAAARTSSRELKTVLGEHLPQRFAQAWCGRCAPSRPMNQYSAKDLEGIAQRLERWEVRPSGTEGYAKAEVTLGGVDTAELSSKTMEARRVPGLHFIGEVVDVTGWLGGYNFQWAWASGHAAGLAV